MKRTSLIVAWRLHGALAIASIAIALSACTHPSTGEAAPSSASDESPRSVVIATIATHDSKVSILGHGEGSRDDLRVVIRRLDGTVVADNVALDDLRAKDPEVYAIVTSAVASRDGKTTERGTYVDAKLDPRPHGARSP